MGSVSEHAAHEDRKDADKSGTDGLAARVSANEILAMLGYGAFIGWFFLSAFDLLPLCVFLEQAPLSFSISLVAFFFGMLTMTFVSAFAPIRMLMRAERLFPPIGFVLSLLLPTYLLLLPFIGDAQIPLILMLAFVSGVASSAQYYLWDSLCLRLLLPNHIRFLGVSLIIGSCFYLFTRLMVAGELHGVVCILLIVCSVFLVLYLRRGTERFTDAFLPDEDDMTSKAVFGKKNRPEIAKLNKHVRLLFFLFGIAFGIAWIMLVNRYPLTLDPVFGFIIIGMIVLRLVLRSECQMHDRYVSMLMRICIVVIVVCFLMVLVAPGLAGTLFLGVVCSFWQDFWVVDTALLLRHAQKHAFSILKHTSTGKFTGIAGLLIGLLCALVLLCLVGYEQALIILFCAVIIVCIVSSMTLMPFSKTTMLGSEESAEEADVAIATRRGQVDGWELPCKRLVEAYGLSPREAEILECMASGQNNKAISENLVLSEHTVKSHVYNIYQKLGIHSRQEMFEELGRFS